MKKTLAALFVTGALTATSATAITVYQQDGTRVELNGSLNVLLTKSKKQRADLSHDHSYIGVKATHDLGNGISVLGVTKIGLLHPAKQVDREPKKEAGILLDELYAGFDFEGIGKLTFGKQETNLSEVSFANYTYLKKEEHLSLASPHYDKVARFSSASWNGFRFGLDYSFYDKPKEAKQDKYWRGLSASVFYQQKFGDFGVDLAAGYLDHRGPAVTWFKHRPQHNRGFALAGQLSYGDFAVGVDYHKVKMHLFELPKAWQHYVETVLDIGLKYQVQDNTKVYAQYRRYKSTNVSEKAWVENNQNYYTLGVGHKLNKNVETFLEARRFINKIRPSNSDYETRIGLLVRF